MASVRKRTWNHKGQQKEAWVVAYTDQGGKRRIKTFDKKKEADRYRTQVESEIENGTHIARNDTVSVKTVADSFVVESNRRWKRGDITGETVRGYEYVMRRIQEKFGGRIITDLTAQNIQDYLDELGDTLGANSLHGLRRGFSMLFKHAIKRRWCKINPLVDDPVSVPKPPRRVEIPSKEDIKKLLECTSVRGRNEYGKKEDLKTFLVRQLVVRLGIMGGLRPGEIFGLQWADVNFDRNVLHIKHSHSRVDGLKGTKTDAGVRDVPMTSWIRESLINMAAYHQLRDEWKAKELKDGLNPRAVNNTILARWDARSSDIDLRNLDGPVIRAVLKHGQTGLTNSQVWRGLMQKAGLWIDSEKRAKFTMHALRHAAVSLFIEAGLPPMNLTALIGHRSVMTTYNVYGHLFPEDTRIADTANQIAAAFSATTARHESVIN